MRINLFTFCLLLTSFFFVNKSNAQVQPVFAPDIYNKDTNGIVKAPLTNNGSKVLVDSGWTSKAAFFLGMFDTTSLSNRININKQAIIDTAAQLRNAINAVSQTDHDKDSTNEIQNLKLSVHLM